MNVVDSSAWLAYFADELTANYFAPAIEDTAALVVPVVCLYEVSKIVRRERGEEAAFQIVAAMQQGLTIDLDANLALEAATLGLEEHLALADSIVYAVAKAYGATLWTQDTHFAGKPGVNYIANVKG
ncbi:MAG: type II toxin-antitoxin system VapC family toxin [Opitutaceae bacterium]|nr:type II toxin-antitoxin system VapC family toxin [Opitutaceae bacterium]